MQNSGREAQLSGRHLNQSATLQVQPNEDYPAPGIFLELGFWGRIVFHWRAYG